MKTKLALLLIAACCLAPALRLTAGQPALDVAAFLPLKNRAVAAPMAVKGEIAFVYACPPCPRGAMCKPCGGDHIFLKSPVTGDEIVVNFAPGDKAYAGLKTGLRAELLLLYEPGGHSWGAANKHGSFICKGVLGTSKKKPRP